MWQIIVSLIAGISAKEVVVSSFSVLFGAGSGEMVSGIVPYINPDGSSIRLFIFRQFY